MEKETESGSSLLSFISSIEPVPLLVLLGSLKSSNLSVFWETLAVKSSTCSWTYSRNASLDHQHILFYDNCRGPRKERGHGSPRLQGVYKLMPLLPNPRVSSPITCTIDLNLVLTWLALILVIFPPSDWKRQTIKSSELSTYPCTCCTIRAYALTGFRMESLVLNI